MANNTCSTQLPTRTYRPARHFYCTCQKFPLHLPEPSMSFP